MTSQGSRQRVIPRPSERRQRVSQIEADLAIISEPPPEVVRSAGSTKSSSSWLFVALGVFGILASGTGFGFLGLTQRQETTVGLALIPIVGLVAFSGIRRWVTPKHGEWFGAVIFAGFGIRALAAVPRLMGGADAPIYQATGRQIALALRQFNFTVDTGRAIPGTGSIRYLSGIVNVFTGSSYLGTFMVFVAIGFVGQVVFLIGVKSTLNPRQFRLLTLFMMFSPTLAFWPSSIGKESVVLFGTGLIVLGSSRLYDRSWSGVPYVLVGVFAVGMVRPHVAMVILAAMLVGLLARRARTRGRALSHLVVLVVVIVGSMWAANASANLFGLESLDGLADLSAALDFAQDRTSQDDSRFVASRVESPRDFPMALITVLFRPFPWEAVGPMALLSSIEGLAMLALVLRSTPGALVKFGGIVERGQLLMAVTYISVFVFIFSAIGNFGILSRQRAQVVPFVLLLVAFGIGLDEKRRSARTT